MKGKTPIIVIFAILILFIAFFCFWLTPQRPKQYGNNMETIKKIVLENDALTKVSVFDIIDIGKYRIAGFKEGDYVSDYIGYALFVRDEENNYCYLSMQKNRKTSDNITVDFSQIGNKFYDVILSNNLNLAKVERIMHKEDADIISVKIRDNPSITLLELPSDFEGEITYNFYDKNGIAIE